MTNTAWVWTGIMRQGQAFRPGMEPHLRAHQSSLTKTGLGDAAGVGRRLAETLAEDGIDPAKALGADRGHAEDGCAFAWAKLCATQPERSEHLFVWLRTTAIREAWRLAQRERRESAPGAPRDDAGPNRRGRSTSQRPRPSSRR